MRWRWRKSIGFGPFRTNLSSGGVGWSIGLPGFRYGISATGRRYISVGIPGTGIYGTQYLGQAPVAPVAHRTVLPSSPVQPVNSPPASPPRILPPPVAQKWWQQKNLP